MAAPSTDMELKKLAEEFSPALTQLEISLIVTHNAFQQWVSCCGVAAGAAGFSSLELLVLHMINYGNGTKRIADICFALKIEDTHLVSYALKKLTKADLVVSRKVGKDTFFSCTATGKGLVDEYGRIRDRCLVRTLSRFAGKDLDLGEMADMLRVLSGLYEQAARQAETAP